MQITGYNSSINFQARLSIKHDSGLYSNFVNNPRVKSYLSLEKKHQGSVGLASYSSGTGLLSTAAVGSIESTVGQAISSPSVASAGMSLFPFGYVSILRGLRNLEIFANKKYFATIKNIPD